MTVVLSLGAGVQSSTLLLMACRGELELDAAIFADTGWEPAAVYEYLDWLRAEANKANIPLYTVRSGSIREDTLSDGRKFSTMPLFVKKPDGRRGMLPRQCTSQYKITPIRRLLREWGATAKQPVELVLGISLDEYRRMRDADVKYLKHSFPLVDRRLTRADCLTWLGAHGYPTPQKSACIGCPYRDAAGWRELTPSEFADAVAFDAAIRRGVTRGGDPAFLHQSLVPLDMVDLRAKQDRSQAEMNFDGCGVLCRGEQN